MQNHRTSACQTEMCPEGVWTCNQYDCAFNNNLTIALMLNRCSIDAMEDTDTTGCEYHITLKRIAFNIEIKTKKKEVYTRNYLSQIRVMNNYEMYPLII